MAADVVEGARPAVLAADHDDAVAADLAHQEACPARRPARRGRRRSSRAKMFSSSQSSTAGSAKAARRQHRRPLQRLAASPTTSSGVERQGGRHRPRDRMRVVDLVVKSHVRVRRDAGHGASRRPLEPDPAGWTSEPRSSRRAPGAFVEEVLMPLEEEAERRGGRLPEETIAEVKREAIEAGLAGGLHAPEHGGQGWTRLEWALVEEQYGRTHQRDPLARPQRLQRLGARQRRADRALPAPGAARRAQGRLRGHRARRRLRSLADRGHRRADRRRLPDQRREVVRDLRRRRHGATS